MERASYWLGFGTALPFVLIASFGRRATRFIEAGGSG